MRPSPHDHHRVELLYGRCRLSASGARRRRRRTHLRGGVHRWLGETGQRIIAIITLFVSLAVCMLFTGKTWEEAIRQMESGAAVLQGNSTVTIWPSNFLLPIGFGLMVIVLIIKLIGYLSRSARSPFLPDFTRLDPVENFND
ncbi:TRAP transporter small permease [Seohaeicola zhoushanensis]